MEAAFGRHARDRLKSSLVVAEAQQVVAELPFGIEAELVARVARVGAFDRAAVAMPVMLQVLEYTPVALRRYSGRASMISGQPVAALLMSPVYCTGRPAGREQVLARARTRRGRPAPTA